MLKITKETRVFIDMDGVLADLILDWLTIYREKGGIQIFPEDIKAWDCPEIPQEHRAMFFDILGTPDLFANLTPINRAVEAMRFICKYFPRTYIVTSSPNKHPNVVSDKVRWVQKHLPFMAHDHFISATHKYLLATPDSVLVDDSPKNVTEFIKAGGQAICIDYPYNRDIDPDIPRYPSLETAVMHHFYNAEGHDAAKMMDEYLNGKAFTFGVIPPPSLEWQMGKTAAEIDAAYESASVFPNLTPRRRRSLAYWKLPPEIQDHLEYSDEKQDFIDSLRSHGERVADERYDLAESIRRGEEDAAAGRVYTDEEATRILKGQFSRWRDIKRNKEKKGSKA